MSIYDHVIRCTGFKYVDTTLFAADIVPDVDKKTKYPVLSSCWESSVPNLFYIGTAMGGWDRKTASSFIHGFRYNIKTLFHLLEERYYGIPLPSPQFRLQNIDDLNALVEFLIQRLSTTSALYQLFGFLGDVLIFSEGKAEFFYELPVDYVLKNPKFTDKKEIVIITLEFGFDRYPAHANTLGFVRPPTRIDCAAFLHALFRHYVNGELVAKFNLDESLSIRYDAEAYDPAERSNRPIVSKNLLMNFINQVAKIVPGELQPEPLYPDSARRFIPWSPDDPRTHEHRLPVCLAELHEMPPKIV